MRALPRRPVVACSVAAAFLWAIAAPAAAQYFGRNKVHYKDFDFKVLKTEHFDLYFYPEEQQGVEILARLAERWHARLERALEHELRGRQPVLMYASHPDFEQTNAIPGELSESTGGVTEPLRRRIVLPFAGPIADTDHVLGHELVHAFQFDITTPGEGANQGRSALGQLPLWFVEGMAEYLSIGPVDANTAMWLRDAARRETLPTIADLDSGKYFPYRWGQAFWAYVGGRWGDHVIPQMLTTAAVAGDVGLAIEQVLGVKAEDLSKAWHEAIHRTYEPVFAAATPGDPGRLVIKGTSLDNLNVAPSISPDGRWLAFLSARGFLSIDLYVADASTGRVVRRLTSTATDPDYSSIQFIYSAGAWDATSTRIAMAVIQAGRPALAVFEAATGRKEREIAMPQVDEVVNPTWAPDGHAIAFTGLRQGLTDLYVYDLAKATLRSITNDAYADVQPAWSPDGRHLAFATDRFSTNLGALATGPYRLAIVDIETGRIEQLRAFLAGKNMNPQWSPDGRAVYFISDRDGVSNLYRVAVETGEVEQLTKVGTGLSGITASSPALSVSSKSGTAAFTVYKEGGYDIYTLPTSTRGEPPGTVAFNAAALPPADRKPGLVARLLADASLGLPPPATTPEIAAYKSTLGLEGLGQPMIAVGASRFGAAIGGGISFYFSDMLGNHSLGTTVQFMNLSNSISAKDLAGQVAYTNQAHRWNWGIVAGQAPYVSGGFTSELGVTSGGDIVGVDRTILFRQTERSASGVVAYPFDRARRLEFTGGVSQVSFDQVVQTAVYDLNTGTVLATDTTTTSLGQSLALGTSSAALVFDAANYGATSPVAGQRYRLEVAPTFGSINFTTLLADYRRYLMPVPFYTIAARALHYGRYGAGGEDARLNRLYIGYPTLVRGYDMYTFDASECPAGRCPVIDRLAGSRMLVGNLEFRFPLLRPFGVSSRMYGPLPVEVALFADGGVAWTSGDRPAFLGGTREGVASVGATLRMNLFGAAVLQFDFARPLQRPARGWVFDFALAPGF